MVLSEVMICESKCEGAVPLSLIPAFSNSLPTSLIFIDFINVRALSSLLTTELFINVKYEDSKNSKW